MIDNYKIFYNVYSHHSLNVSIKKLRENDVAYISSLSPFFSDRFDEEITDLINHNEGDLVRALLVATGIDLNPITIWNPKHQLYNEEVLPLQSYSLTQEDLNFLTLKYREYDQDDHQNNSFLLTITILK